MPFKSRAHCATHPIEMHNECVFAFRWIAYYFEPTHTRARVSVEWLNRACCHTIVFAVVSVWTRSLFDVRASCIAMVQMTQINWFCERDFPNVLVCASLCPLAAHPIRFDFAVCVSVCVCGWVLFSEESGSSAFVGNEHSLALQWNGKYACCEVWKKPRLEMILNGCRTLFFFAPLLGKTNCYALI